MRKRLAALFKKACDFSILPRDSPRTRLYRFVDFPSARVFFGYRGGFSPHSQPRRKFSIFLYSRSLQ